MIGISRLVMSLVSLSLVIGPALGATSVPEVPRAPRAPTALVLFDRHACDEAWLATLTSLQGLIARQGGARQLYLTERGSGQAIWPEELARTHGVRLARATDPLAVLRELKGAARGYVVFDRNDAESVNAATLLAALRDAVLVERAHEAAVRDTGLACLGDGRGGSAVEIVRRERAHLDGFALAEQSGERLWGLRDYLVLGRLPLVYDRDLTELTDGHDRPLFGWGNAVHGEREFISRHSRLGLFTVPSDHASNLSVLSAFRAETPLRQKPVAAAEPPTGAVHLVTFVLTDGDNLGWVLGDFAANPRWFGSPARGRIPLGFGLPPTIVDLAPDALGWFYDQAARTAAGSDRFVVGPSGAGYFFPSQYPAAALREHVTRLAGLMERADLRLVEIIDENALERTDVWAEYLRQPQIDGLIYLDYAPYNKGHGRIVWAAGKPVVSVRSLLWQGQAGADPESLVRQLNAAPRDLRTPDGYTIVSVHAWSQTLVDIEAVACRLDPAVRVVTPDLFFSTLRANLHSDSP